ncbi:MAG: Holliday junction resolvase RuvX [Propionibacteriaceae bacterium]|jgi:putative Holliday junction resolvase|nr:Holliday junction resolvase RuvX [Propionibacteriaceae bacterium]
MDLRETSGPLISLDLGSARIGVAACDAQRVLAYPVEVIPAGDLALKRIIEIAEEYDPVAVIIGHPLNLSGGEGLAAHRTQTQARDIAEALEMPVLLADERMSSGDAHRRLRLAGRNAKNSRGIVDAQAAVCILETVLHALDQAQDITYEVGVCQ